MLGTGKDTEWKEEDLVQVPCQPAPPQSICERKQALTCRPAS